jgi:peptidoglycan/LPS O-acetylase OafA/YrhL
MAADNTMTSTSSDPRTMTTVNERYYFLDGLRGWAALAVVFWHVFCESYPISQAAADFLRFLPPFNGNVAVDLFFVISGFALSINYAKRRDSKSLARIGAGRYLRLAIPILAACTLVHFAMLSESIAPFELRPTPYNYYLRFEPTFSHLFTSSLFDVFFRFSKDQVYIVPLWSMQFELIGSAITIGFLAIFGRDKLALWIFGAALFTVTLIQNSYYSLFVAGMLLANIYVTYDLSGKRFQSLLCLGILLGWTAPFLTNNDLRSPFFMGSMIIFFSSMIWITPIRSFFEKKPSLFLGRISFPLYLLHGPVLWTFSLSLKTMLARFVPIDGNVNFVIGFATVLVSIGVSIAFLPVEKFAIAASRSFGTWLVNSVNSKIRLLTPKSN